MPVVESFTDLAPGAIASTDYVYVRSSAAAEPKDRRFAFPALLRQLIGAADVPTARGFLGFLTATASLDFPSIAAVSQADLTIAVAGAAVGDGVFLGLPVAPLAGLVFNAFVSAANTVTVRASNITAGAVDESAMTFRVIVIKSA